MTEGLSRGMGLGLGQGLAAGLVCVAVLTWAALRASDPVWRLILTAFGLRFGVAMVTEYYPVFPPYYYFDAQTYEGWAWQFVQNLRASLPEPPAASLSHRSFGLFLSVFYWAFGRSPLLLKVVNALLGALLVWVIYRTARLVTTQPDPAGQRVAWWSGVLTAVWPSSVFWTAQIFRDPLIGLLTACSLWLMAEWFAGLAAKPPFWARFGLLAKSMLLAAGSYLLRTQQAGFWILTFLASLGGMLAANARWFWSVILLACAGLLIVVLGVTPQGLTQMHTHLTTMSWGSHGGTTLFPGLAFDSWSDVLYFLPKGMFYVLFMPLPVLYPLEDNLGRWAAALENTALLAFGFAAVGYLWRWRGGAQPKTQPKAHRAAWPVVTFVFLMAAAQALTEPDLGSAMRHKFYYLPYLFILGLDCLWSWRRKAWNRHPSSA